MAEKRPPNRIPYHFSKKKKLIFLFVFLLIFARFRSKTLLTPPFFHHLYAKSAHSDPKNTSKPPISRYEWLKTPPNPGDLAQTFRLGAARHLARGELAAAGGAYAGLGGGCRVRFGGVLGGFLIGKVVFLMRKSVNLIGNGGDLRVFDRKKWKIEGF
jgi:hypothetical protein